MYNLFILINPWKYVFIVSYEIQDVGDSDRKSAPEMHMS